MKQALLLSFLTIVFYLPYLGQGKETRKLFDFGARSCDEMTHWIDILQQTLEKEPDAKAYIIYYSGFYFSTQRKGITTTKILTDLKAHSFAYAVKRQLTELEKVDETKFEIINGGYQERVLFEVWLVPKGATVPTPNPTVNPKDKKFRKMKVDKKFVPCLM